MAAPKPLIDDIVNELNCVVCLEQKRLHLLPCVHRCCQECIGNLAGDDGQFPCPICRRDVVVPDEGFPVCLLSEFLREKVKLTPNQGSASTCRSCKVKSVEARCRECLRFICYRCAMRGACEKTSGGKHDCDDLEERAAVASSQLDEWKVKTKHEIIALEEVVRQKQREIEDKKNVLEACENIDKQSDSAERITLIEQICSVQISTSHIGVAPENPKELRFISLHPTDSQCTTVSHVGDDKLALGCSTGLKIYNKTTAKESLVNKLTNTNVAVYNGKLFLSYKQGGSRIVVRSDSSGTEDLFHFVMKSNRVCQIAANQHYILALDRDNNKIKVYIRSAKVVLTKNLPGLSKVFNVKFSSDGSLLIAGVESSGKKSLTKFGIRNSPNPNLNLMWSVKLENVVVGMAVTEAGTIYVTEKNNKRIYVISNEGEKLVTLSHEQLPDNSEGISIRGDELAVAGWNNLNFMLFKIV